MSILKLMRDRQMYKYGQRVKTFRRWRELGVTNSEIPECHWTSTQCTGSNTSYIVVD
jgi:hypothetical protein